LEKKKGIPILKGNTHTSGHFLICVWI
jgi:hypothetical protein